MRSSAVPLLIATLIAIAGFYGSQIQGLDSYPPAILSQWLTLPLFALAIACCIAAAKTWPTFAQRQPGADTVRRIERGLLGGRGAVIVGTCLANLLLSAATIAVLLSVFEAPSHARRYYQPTIPEYPILDRNGAKLAFPLQNAPMVEAIWLRPIASLPEGPPTTEVSLTAKGAALTSTPIVFVESGALVRVPIAPQKVQQLELTQLSGGLPLLFGQANITALGPANLPTWQNGLVAACLAAGTCLITMVVAALLGLVSGWPTVATVICAIMFVQWIGGVGPIDDALLATLRGRWIL